MNSGASLISDILRAIRVQSSSLIRPDRMSASRIRASADSSRITISERLISSENTALVRPWRTEQERAKSSPSVDLPKPGRAAPPHLPGSGRWWPVRSRSGWHADRHATRGGYGVDLVHGRLRLLERD